jgi:hypothetical protein
MSLGGIAACCSQAGLLLKKKGAIELVEMMWQLEEG